MKGKALVSIIIDVDSQIKSAIKQAFPEAHHRLCTWHLLRNATSNIGKPKFTRMFRDCMLGDYEVRTFQKSGLRWLRNLASPIKDGYRTCMRKGTVGPQHTYGESSLPDFEQHQALRERRWARNRPRRNTKGNGAHGGKKTQRCRLCREVGHNRTTCSNRCTMESSRAVADDMDSMDTDMVGWSLYR
ncbi:hypothetical protein Ahy_A06g028520 [Arachis hypogaea]|uniref:MULE transposase domain-containing protein n=1 Tax=Arachis hypogaea TaxID=3818 RepID=A0A445CRA5_ARAHY|nr:hypothetical protein Ahy_A06g028520 [Arachis hypogaea]